IFFMLEILKGITMFRFKVKNNIYNFLKYQTLEFDDISAIIYVFNVYNEPLSKVRIGINNTLYNIREIIKNDELNFLDISKETFLRKERKFLNYEIFPDKIFLTTELRLKTLQKNKEILYEILKFISTIKFKYSNFRMISSELLFSLWQGQQLSSAILFRALIVSFCQEFLIKKNESKTSVKKKLSNFKKSKKEIFDIFSETKHFEFGFKQFERDIWYEIDLIIEQNDCYPNSLNEIDKKKIDNLINQIKINSNEYQDDLWNNYNECIKFCNSVAHSEILFTDNNSKEAFKLNGNTKLIFTNFIALIINLKENL
ncbi:MAG: hypothetical protein ACRDCG_01625, partial [Mycoplasmoidaceae bacterium]